MEWMESVAMDNSEVSDERINLSADGHVLSSSSFKESDIIGNESAFYEKFLLDDLDNYWDEVNDRLTVSRMVSDSIIKGMVHAVVEESAEKIASMEAEITILNEKLQSYDSNAAIGNMLTGSPVHHSSLDASVEWNYGEKLGRLRVAAEEQLQKLEEGIRNVRISNSYGRINSSSTGVGLCNVLPQARTSEQLLGIDERVDSLRVIVAAIFEEVNGMFHSMKASVFEQQLEHEFQRGINAIILQNCVRGIRDEFETKLYEQRNLINMLNMNWQQKVAELSAMRDDLDVISRSLFSSESGQLFSHNSQESFEEWNTTKRTDQFPRKVLGNHNLPFTTHAEENCSTLTKKSEDVGKPLLDVADSSQLKHMSKEELIAYYKTEMIKMRRQHDSALQEKTEELFSLKREFLKEKGSSPFRKDKELELLKKKFPEVILKLDDILLEKEKLPTIQSDYDQSCSLKARIDTLFYENQHLRDLLTEKRKEVKCLSSQVSDAASQMSFHSSAEAKFLNQIKKLKGNLEDVKIEAGIIDELHGIFLKEVIGEYKCGVEDREIETKIVQETYTTAVRGFIGDAMSTITSFILKYFTEKSSLEALLFEKEMALCLEIEENEKLKEAITSLSTLMREKENFASETGSKLMEQKEQFDLLNQELNMIREEVSKQGILILKDMAESDTLKRRLDETLQQFHQNEMEINKLNEKLVIASNALEEAEKQKTMLCDIIEDKEKRMLSSITKEKQQAKCMDSIVISLMELSKSFLDFENKLADNIGRNETRLKVLSHRCSPLVQQANLLTKKGLLHKQMLEIRHSNLQKAEAEVDLLGDEVDALLSLLGKIYIALDHYSPVLQHYPGVMEILNLVQRELEGETTRLA